MVECPVVLPGRVDKLAGKAGPKQRGVPTCPPPRPKRRTNRQFGRKTHSKQLGCCVPKGSPGRFPK
eukprot:scaffold121418_cov48-Phaeocystis_antarctica.AAC.1